MLKKIFLLCFFIFPSIYCVAQGVAENDTLIQLLEETVVIARSKNLIRTTEGGKINLTTDNLHQVPSLLGTPDIIKVLQLMPGVQNSGESNGHLYVRGTDPGHNLILFDEAPIYGTSHLLGIFPFFNTDHAKRVEFDKTGTNAQYSSKLGATLKAISNNQLPEAFSISGNIGLLASQLHTEIPIGKKTALYLSGRQTYVDQVLMPIIESMTSDEDEISDLTYNFSDVNVSLLTKPAPKHQVQVNAFFSKDRFGMKEKESLLDGSMKWTNLTASATWNWEIDAQRNFKQAVYFSQYDNKLFINQATINLDVQSDIKDWGANNTFEFELLRIPLQTGMQFSGYRVSPQKIFANQFTENIPQPDNRVDASLLSLFLQGQPQLTSKLRAEMGIKFNYYHSTHASKKKNSFTHIEPRISLHYAPNTSFNSYVAYACKHQYINLITTSSVGFPTDFWIASSGDIPAQQGHHFSIGSVYKPLYNIEVSANLFYYQLNRLIEYPFNVLQFNEIGSFDDDIYTGKGKSYGLECMVRKTGRLSGWISYTLSRSDRTFSEINENRTFPSKFDRRHNLSAVASYRLSPKWNAALTQVFASGSRFTIPTSWYFINNNPVKEYGDYHNAKMPDYIRTDISFDYFLKKTEQKESVLNFSIYNALGVVNPIYVVLDVETSETGNQIKPRARYKKLYTILPSVSWRFKF
ncbi:TonB-dependent siderophore receptor [Bacteroides sp. 224]|uniref:TonB-dependent receptor plug domain-containing protein n=1 Tax=Bacteroides sp. 224 TaxID=2302936 RepID=UPI0013D3BD81|nr:TonB-dependent receptor plug domain-containing protein [Bacteroides sp. 224]NDV65684.1 oxidoreductase [Bacteroides sp. 224]